jgi:hypothetical protein
MPHRYLKEFKSPRGKDPLYPGAEYFDPSRYWGEKLGLPALFFSYDNVFHGRHAEIEVATRRGDDPLVVDRLHDDLVAAYPDIATIAAASAKERYAVVIGCSSKLVVADIRHYVANYVRIANRGMNDDEAWRLLRVVRLLGFALEWRISPETLGVLENHIGLPNWSSSAADFVDSWLTEFDDDDFFDPL